MFGFASTGKLQRKAFVAQRLFAKTGQTQAIRSNRDLGRRTKEDRLNGKQSKANAVRMRGAIKTSGRDM
jgi:hypothetical protein